MPHQDVQARDTPQPPSEGNKGGAPIGNRNRLRHGLRGSGLPDGCDHIEAATYQFRRAVEDAVFALRGEIGLVDAGLVNTAYRAERHAQLAQRWLHREGEKMNIADRLACSREVVRASEARDKALAALKLPDRSDGATEAWKYLTLPPQADPYAHLPGAVKGGQPSESAEAAGEAAVHAPSNGKAPTATEVEASTTAPEESPHA